MKTNLTLIGAVSCLLNIGYAQTSQSSLVSAVPGGSSANYYFARQGEITMIVNVWGEVQRPGSYEIATTIDLVQLISLSGGPAADADLAEITITRFVESDSANSRKTVMLNLEDLTKLREKDLKLFPGDIIVVEKGAWAGFRDSFGFVAPVITLALTVVQLVVILSR